ncbi:TRAP transporter small permease [Desulfohalobium retbaense]|uniref:Tripartite ATP-independent periplasmic transporter DctQ component n=1 Tax=Desulfohalobium retbaense (strain ATCC 49708 / DSM 5692 / JCM 16813 / HR100) TaxID=485915 RepID=C8X5A8_DESRD|nr:TRAP transporter small permease [Desulfohalobium retbaense]ACV69605.1 Tripartite ATP-independent periplasmic transporter DctQ component [Desulfohalobium retbaense DSM 5692]
MRFILRWTQKIYDYFEEIVCVSTSALMVACLIIQVSARWFTGGGIAWTEELSRFSFLATVIVSAALVAKHGSHVRITAQFLVFSYKVRLFFRVVADALWVSANLYIAWLSWNVIQTALKYPEVSPVLHITKAYVELVVPFGFVLMSWRIIEGYIIRLKRGTLSELVLQDFEMEAE